METQTAQQKETQEQNKIQLSFCMDQEARRSANKQNTFIFIH